MALLILAHQNFSQSIANKTIVNTLLENDRNIEVRTLLNLYPNFQIDIEAEQAALLRHDTIILQYPMYWFNMPAILKLWFDEVFSYQFAYGSQGNKLKHKQVIVSMTIGQKRENFINDQEDLMQSFLKSVECSIQYAQMQLNQCFFSFDLSTVAGHTESEIIEKANTHAQQLSQYLHQLKSNKKLEFSQPIS